MSRIPDTDVDAVRDAIDMDDLIEFYDSSIDRSGMASCVFHEENTPSLSVDRDRGLFHCFGCGVEGDAFELVMAKERLAWRDAVQWLADRYRVTLHDADEQAPRPAPALPPLGPEWTPEILERLQTLKAWNPETIRALRLTIQNGRVAIPVQDAAGERLGTLRYQPNKAKLKEKEPKILATAGTPRALFPAPERVTGSPLWIVEGEPDAITARSIGLPAVAVPGTQSWKPEWAERFKGRDIVICTDCDAGGRDLAMRMTADLQAYATDIRVVDLDRDRDDGYDIGDAAVARRGSLGELRGWLHQQAATVESQKDATAAVVIGGERIEAWQDVMLRSVRGDEPPEADPIPLPFSDLTTAMEGGVRPGQIIVVAGWTGHNKSNFVDMMLDSAAAVGRTAQLYMTEMSLRDRGHRWLARNSTIPFSVLRKGRLQGARLKEAEETIAKLRYPATQVSTWEPEKIAEDIRRCGWGLAVIDHLHDLPYRREEDLRALVQLFAQVARSSTETGPGTCLVLVCQLNDGQMSGQRDNRRTAPGMHSLKGTSAIKQAADEVFFVWMVDEDETGRATTFGEVWNVKGRNNPTAKVKIRLNPDRMKLELNNWTQDARGVPHDRYEDSHP